MIAAIVLSVLGALLLVRLGAEERGGPAHFDSSIGNGLPVTFYVPGAEDADRFPQPPADDHRFPLIIAAHGYSADRNSLSTLSRSLAHAGYAVLAFDFRGHGDNTHPFEGDLRDDFKTAVDWAVTSPYIDPSRIAVLGHSMGAGAALDFASIDDRPIAVVPISGGYAVNDVHLPANVLLLQASGDPDRIKDNQVDVERDLHGRTNVVLTKISGTDHVRIVSENKTVAAITSFLDPILRPESPGVRPAGIVDPRRGTGVRYLLIAIALIGLLGTFIGRALRAPAGGAPGDDTAVPIGRSFLLLIGLLFATMPLLTTGGFNVLPLGAGQPVVVHLALVGGALWALRYGAARAEPGAGLARWIGPGSWWPTRHELLAGLVAFLVAFVLLAPLGVLIHRLVPTTERLVLLAVVAVVALVFFAPFNALVRRGGTWSAIGFGVLGRIVLVVALFVGAGAQVLPPVILLVAPLFVFQYAVVEIFAGACYAAGRSPAVVAVFDALVLAWVVTSFTPIG